MEELISCSRLGFHYPNGKGIEGIDLSLATGSLTALIGRNGAGKSTLISAIAGILVPDSGELRAFDSPIRPGKDISYKARIGLCQSEGGLIENLSLRENFELVSYLRTGKKGAWLDEEGWIEKFGLAPLLSASFDELSAGQRRRALILQALFGRPPVLIFDEPGNDLDIEGIFLLQELLASLKSSRAILVSTHIIDVIRSNADAILFMEKGKIVSRTADCEFGKIETMYKDLIWGEIGKG